MINIEQSFKEAEGLAGLFQNSDENLKQRILSELQFVCLLSAENRGKYDSIISQAEQYIDKEYRAQGAVTRDIVDHAESLLAPAAAEAKSYLFHCVAHAHIDMNWMWGYDETVGTAIDTFRTMLDIMNEYPDYKFSQSQASVYKIVEEYDPEMLIEIKERVKQGRWEITASNWVETDKNMPSGESLSRHILYTKNYISKTFDINPDDLEIDFEPDTFGHSQNVPEILSQGGIKYYYHCRGHVGDQILYRWRAPSGSDVLVYTEPFWYNSDINNDIAFYALELEKRTGSKHLLKVYGVGDHGGGPTRRDIERIIDMNLWPVYPSFHFSTLKAYFSEVSNNKDSRPLLDKEINFLCDGCYTTQTRIKAGNRKSEAMLNEAEAIATMASLQTAVLYPAASFSGAWIKTLFNQFHDIIPGSGITETREYASGLYQQVFATARTNLKSAVKHIIDKIDTLSLFPIPENGKNSIAIGAGPGSSQCGRMAGKTRVFHLFNTSLMQRNSVAELVVWDYEGKEGNLRVFNENGQKVLSQLIDKGGYWGHDFIKILIDSTVPAGGYTTYFIGEDPCYGINATFTNDMRVQTPDQFVLENDLVRVEFSSLDGSIISYFDKGIQKECADKTRKNCIFEFVHEAATKEVTDWKSGMSAWFTGRYKKIECVNDNLEMKILYTGDLRSAMKYETSFDSSHISVTVTLDRNSTALNYAVDCDWREFGGDASGVPALRFCLPLNYNCENYKYDVPFGIADRLPVDMDLPANSFALGNSEHGLKSWILMTKSKYGFRCLDNQIALTLIRGAYDPDPTPEIGMHHIEFAVDSVDYDRGNHYFIAHSYDYNHPIIAMPGTAHHGALAVSKSMFALKSGTAAISCIKTPEKEGKGKVLIRLYETDGNSTNVCLQVGFKTKSACFVDLTERKISEPMSIDGQEISFDLKPYQSASLLIEI